ncbi:MAG TPA: acyl-CoA dehydratase activase [Candidatus Angelobacter sp.]|nr:acyl-CoA dehydratase activase [Candidatus Angelobacter sp.]
MAIHIGLDIGGISIKLAALGSREEIEIFPHTCDGNGVFWRAPEEIEARFNLGIVLSRYRRTFGSPLQAVNELLEQLRLYIPAEHIAGICVTGSGAGFVAEALRARTENEFKALARAMTSAYPEIRTVLEIGGESSKFILLGPQTKQEPAALPVVTNAILDYSTSGECAAGTGAFLDQQASRLTYRVEEIGQVVAAAKCAARIAGRCSVFAKSDMIHAQQRGYGTDEVLKGLCEAVARNFKTNIVRGRKVIPPAALIGAVSQNSGVVQALTEAFRLPPDSLFVPEIYAWLGAVGCALLERKEKQAGVARAKRERSVPKQNQLSAKERAPIDALSLKNVLLLRSNSEASGMELLPNDYATSVPAYLGIDVGSVSTNLAVLDQEGRLLHEIYLRTAGRPIEVVHEGMQEIDRLLGSRIDIRGVGTTGSGRELIGELVGADTVNDEITAHKTGAIYVHERFVRNHAASHGQDRAGEIGGVDTIFEIGGQDAKYISIDHGVVVDFAMNEACAAGTGSFLEEQAERLGIQIKDEFAARALSSKSPARLGERCTVFMERDVTAWLQRGTSVDDLAAGLAYSVALNYLNRVVRGRKIGDVIYFQGGTAYNDAVAAAFSQVLGKRVIVPPHNGVIGAIGMALIAQEVTGARERVRGKAMAATVGGQPEQRHSVSTFRGFDLSRTRFETRDFVCKACSNYCDMKEITVDGRKTYWGDKCSDKFRKRARSERKPVIEDLLAIRDRLLREGYDENVKKERKGRVRVGIPQAMFFYDRFPFWRTYLENLGFEVILSGPTDQQLAQRGVELAIAEPCFPVQIAHGHVQALLQGNADRAAVDFVLLPNVMDTEAPDSPVASYLCPWNQTLPFVVRSAPGFLEHESLFLAPTLYFRLGRRHVKKQLASCFEQIGIAQRQSDAALDAAYAAQASFDEKVLKEGRKACAILEETGEPAVLLVGRAYNLYDRGGNCDIPRKLRDLYGVNVLPLDFLSLDEQSVDDLQSNMFWNSGRRILSAGRFARTHPKLHILYLTNFKCGPDSFVKYYLRGVAHAPFLVLQFDGHGNDAGYLTRCEAYLDSKGVLRCS